jgi:hypothetical protein
MPRSFRYAKTYILYEEIGGIVDKFNFTYYSWCAIV